MIYTGAWPSWARVNFPPNNSLQPRVQNHRERGVQDTGCFLPGAAVQAGLTLYFPDSGFIDQTVAVPSVSGLLKPFPEGGASSLLSFYLLEVFSAVSLTLQPHFVQMRFQCSEMQLSSYCKCRAVLQCLPWVSSDRGPRPPSSTLVQCEPWI